MRRHWFMLLTAGLLLGADKPVGDAGKKELELFQGTWTAVSYHADGKAASDQDLKQIKLVVKGDASTFTRGKETLQGTYKADPTQKPKALDILLTDGPDKGKAKLAIYEIQGDSLKISVAPVGKPRPKDFTPAAGSTVEVWKKEKVETPPKPAPPAFTDKNLEAAIRAVLQDTKAELTDQLLNNVFFLEAPGKNIANLKGLERCKNLALLKLTKNQIADLGPLQGLANLQSLDLADNKISDVKPLAGLTRLQYLELSNNQISDVKPLVGLSALSSLYLNGNKISDIGPLGSLGKLSSLSLGNNQIRDLAPLTKVTKLTTLDLNENQIVDLGPLTKQTELSLLMLEKNKITDLAPLVAMAKADVEGPKRFAPYLRLYLKGNPLSDAAKTGQLEALKKYGVRVNN